MIIKNKIFIGGNTMKTVRLLSLVLAVLMLAACLTACPSPEPGTTTTTTTTKKKTEVVTKPLVYAEGTVLRMATGYNSTKTGISFTADSGIGDGITLADGVTYHQGDLKPTWVELQKVLNVVFQDKYTGKKASEEFKHWQEQLDQVDMVSGTASGLSEAGVAGQLVNLADYLEYMPNFRKYLEDNPIVRLSITGDTDTGAIYFSPYFDGVNDIERMPLMRTDWVEKLLNGEGDFTADKSNNLKSAAYTPYMPTSGKVTVDAVNKEGTAVIELTKDYDKAGNIVQIMNDALAKGTVTGVQAVNMLRKYIDEAYNGYYGTNRADLFIGQDAAWDADELVALLRCVVANPQTLNGTDTVQGLFSREDNNVQRQVDMFRFAGTLFGVRGLESRQDYLYVGSDGQLHDARLEADTYEAIERMNALTKEGLISDSFVSESSVNTESMLKNDAGFMHYDYNQTQTAYNETALDNSKGEKYMAVMVPVARWNDGEGEKYMRFTESWRSVKTDGWAISKAGVGDDQDKLMAALALIDYAYSKEGQILMSYGPDAFIKTNADGSYVTFNFNGEQWPVIADATYNELWSLAKGNYTNYARLYLGSTLSFVKSQAFEYQCTHVVGKEGAGNISTAIALGTIKHPELAITENPWYTSVPTTLPTTKEQNSLINSWTDFVGDGSAFSQSKGKINIFLHIIRGGYTSEQVAKYASNSAELLDKATNEWHGKQYLSIKNSAWERLQNYYASIVND